ncbi:LNS2-domain-containing protein [Hortaea werneckii]|uniref:LNS2/PITP domain-containing protein n=2 Tax=Hortaea werneckii TaxID=91943 RepID=A0A3M7IU28_HORWE|nr:LNS2-domain-containing protein [Hortaea werneckii]OTA22996.1 hypothetical protein BTJ68_13997 [Hortaea werneckii EXF-2000]KAI6804343.1 LNS2-domain-containing protein [Hortaea werneckii]KAI6904274.1 LNS2-domain-containing protein [Hortaea werneckii]KAI6923001.1 LNS2-domain-containing protein [Hortaea werneckii]
MQYVRSLPTTLSKTWNSINPATLSGAIDVIVVEQEDGSLACSPFHIRFGKFSLLRPYEKKVEFRVNGEVVNYPMKLGEGGEAFFVFETDERVPEALRTSPVVSPAASPELRPETEGGRVRDVVEGAQERLGEPEPFALEDQGGGGGGGGGEPGLNGGTQRKQHSKSASEDMLVSSDSRRVQSDIGTAPLAQTNSDPVRRPASQDMSHLKPHLAAKLERTATDSAMPEVKKAISNSLGSSEPFPETLHRPGSPLRTRTGHENYLSTPQPTASNEEAKSRAMNLSKKLWTSNISNQVTESGDLMLDMASFKSSNNEGLQAEIIARQLLSEEIDGPYDIGSLIGADEKGNIWIYSSEEAKEAAAKKASEGTLGSFHPAGYASSDAISDPGYHSDDARSESNATYTSSANSTAHIRRDSDSAVGLTSQPTSPTSSTSSTTEKNTAPPFGDPNKNYAKTLRLTTEQLKTMNLRRGANTMSFTVNRATCTAILYYWQYDVPIVISDIDGTITKSDVLGHVLNTLGRDWTHQGVAKLFSEISQNGYNFLYLTSRSVGQADSTRAYLDGVVQDGFKLPKGPVILSPDRTIAALRREIYLRKPEIFKMACLRDIMALFSGQGGANNTHESAEAGLHTHLNPGGLGSGKGKSGSPFYAGFGNRLTDALSYRSVNIPSTRIFTINSNSEVSLDLLSLNKYKTAYGSMREIVDHYFPPVGLLVKGGGEEFTDFNYWREKPLDIVDFTDSESEEEEEGQDKAIVNALQRTDTRATKESLILSEDEAGDDMGESYMTDPRLSLEESVPESVADEDDLADSYLDDEEDDGDDELDPGTDDEEEGGVKVKGEEESTRVPDVGDKDVDEYTDEEDYESDREDLQVTPKKGGR